VELLSATERERDGLASRLAAAEVQQRQWADASANSSALARLQRDLADMTDQYREERDRCLRLEEEVERSKSRAEVRAREAESARTQYEEQVRNRR
jgi:predicted  nucleic acid-binding Zn-ribbon protein